jgi:hypothetical protein
VKQVTVRLQAIGAGGPVRVDVGGQAMTTPVPADGDTTLTLEPGSGFQYYDSFLYRAVFDSKVSGPVFVDIALEVNRRPRP